MQDSWANITQPVLVMFPETGPAGGLYIPPQMASQPNSSLSVAVGLPSLLSQQPGSVVVDINMVDGNGVPITQLEAPLIICFVPPNNTKSNYCLGYYSVRDAKWVCEDECLLSNKNGLWCGQTDHLTNFALLLSSVNKGQKESNPCQSVSQSDTLAWISLGLVIGAILWVALGILAIEVYYRTARDLSRYI